ncbi:hypothetical protein PR202_ga10045 [Eleusine coracana subsp. coracana]|uniref:Peptidyl-tRNA hydrolase n=1 Tax=Eleusine coracana subsp. coracana TaxID=191504 RepID=A0AAV5C5P4_ELECO|nr:hypothetical protein PR202_ga10045 [Eleusine coracana subsp. coracana]
MRFLSGASASRLPAPLSLSRARLRCLPTSISGLACRAASSSGTAAGDGAARKPWLFVGLGNPGKVYQGTRHNVPLLWLVVTSEYWVVEMVGFEMIDVIAEAEGISISSMQFKAMVGKGRIGDSPIMLAKPQTFMNASGESVGQLVSYFKIPLNQVIVALGGHLGRWILQILSFGLSLGRSKQRFSLECLGDDPVRNIVEFV